MLKTRANGASPARRLRGVMLLSAAFFAASLVTVAAQDAVPITAAQLGMIEDMTNGALGHNETFAAQPAQLLGVHGSVGRQMSANDDKDTTNIHYFNLFSSDPGAIVLIYEKRGSFVRAFRVDERLQFVRGYISTGQNNQVNDVPISNKDGVGGTLAELKWWGATSSEVVKDVQAALVADQSLDDVAKSYGVSAQTLNKWLAAAKQP